MIVVIKSRCIADEIQMFGMKPLSGNSLRLMPELTPQHLQGDGLVTGNDTFTDKVP